MARENKRKKEFNINFSENRVLGKPSPYVIDLKKIIDESPKVEVTPKSIKKKKELPRFFELTIPSFLFSLVRASKKIISSFRVMIGRLAKFLVVKTKNLVNLFFRLIKFFEFSLADYKKILSFGLLAFILVLPLQTFSYYESLKMVRGEALGEAENAYLNFLTGGTSLTNADFREAAENFSQAAGSFSEARGELSKINFIVASLLKTIPSKGKQLETGRTLFLVGEKLSWAGENILKGMAQLTDDDKKPLTQKIKIFRNRLVVVLPEIAEAMEKLNKVDIQSVPEDKQEIFSKLKDRQSVLMQNLKNLISIADFMIKFLGDESEKRYLFIFQNTGEIRPTGGFMGSLALVDFDRGQIKNMEVPGGGSYDFQGSLKEKVISPEPLQLINPYWQLQDANWFSDFSASAKKIKWFYEKSGGPTVDGVVAINSDLVVDLLGVIGPIEMVDYNKTINQNNFILEIQKAVEVEYDKKENKPKQIIADLTPKLIEKVLAANPAQFGEILSILARGLNEKKILIYSVFPEIEHQILNFSWGGEIKKIEEGDYLLVVNANIGGGKTDSVMEEKIRHESTIFEDGHVKNKVIIEREHRGVKGEIFTGVRNVDYLRIYVPSGSTLLAVEGFEAPPENLFEKADSNYRMDADLQDTEGKVLIDKESGTRITEEFGKTVFGNWAQVDPGEEVTVSFEYLLPFKLPRLEAEKDWRASLLERFGQPQKEQIFYKFLVQKQPGTHASFSSQLNFPDDWQPVLNYGDIHFSPGMAMTSGLLNLDKFNFIVFEK